jgi:hypothetical protein
MIERFTGPSQMHDEVRCYDLVVRVRKRSRYNQVYSLAELYTRSAVLVGFLHKCTLKRLLPEHYLVNYSTSVL